MRVGLGPGVREPVNILRATPTDSNTARRAEPRLRSLRILRVSLPWMVLASAQRLRPSDVFGPVDLPPCREHVLRPAIERAMHRWPVALNTAAQRTHCIVPVCSIVVIVFACNVTF